MTVLIDGTGKGYRAGVNSKNQLQTQSSAKPIISEVSDLEGKTFQAHIQRTVSAANTFENIGQLRYTGSSKLHVESILFSREDVSLANTGQAVFEVLFDVSYTSGGGLFEPINLNMGSGQVSNLTVYTAEDTALVLDSTNERELMDFACQNYYHHSFQGSFILTQNQEFAIIGKSKNISDVLHVVMFYYEE